MEYIASDDVCQAVSWSSQVGWNKFHRLRQFHKIIHPLYYSQPSRMIFAVLARNNTPKNWNIYLPMQIDETMNTDVHADISRDPVTTVKKNVPPLIHERAYRDITSIIAAVMVTCNYNQKRWWNTFHPTVSIPRMNRWNTFHPTSLSHKRFLTNC